MEFALAWEKKYDYYSKSWKKSQVKLGIRVHLNQMLSMQKRTEMSNVH